MHAYELVTAAVAWQLQLLQCAPSVLPCWVIFTMQRVDPWHTRLASMAFKLVNSLPGLWVWNFQQDQAAFTYENALRDYVSIPVLSSLWNTPLSRAPAFFLSPARRALAGVSHGSCFACRVLQEAACWRSGSEWLSLPLRWSRSLSRSTGSLSATTECFRGCRSGPRTSHTRWGEEFTAGFCEFKPHHFKRQELQISLLSWCNHSMHLSSVAPILMFSKSAVTWLYTCFELVRRPDYCLSILM